MRPFLLEKLRVRGKILHELARDGRAFLRENLKPGNRQRFRGSAARSLPGGFFRGQEKIDEDGGGISFRDDERVRERRRSRRGAPVADDEGLLDFLARGNAQQIRAAVRVGAVKRGNFFGTDPAAGSEEIRPRREPLLRRQRAQRREHDAAGRQRGIERGGDETVVRENERACRFRNDAGTRDEVLRERVEHGAAGKRKVFEADAGKRGEAPLLHAAVRQRQRVEIRPRAFAARRESVVPAAFPFRFAKSFFRKNALRRVLPHAHEDDFLRCSF